MGGGAKGHAHNGALETPKRLARCLAARPGVAAHPHWLARCAEPLGCPLLRHDLGRPCPGERTTPAFQVLAGMQARGALNLAAPQQWKRSTRIGQRCMETHVSRPPRRRRTAQRPSIRPSIHPTTTTPVVIMGFAVAPSPAPDVSVAFRCHTLGWRLAGTLFRSKRGSCPRHCRGTVGCLLSVSLIN